MRAMVRAAVAAAILLSAGAAQAESAARILLTPQPQGGPASGALAERLLRAHNQERAALGLAPLAWDARLAASASEWGQALAVAGSLRHAAQSDHGENLWMGTRGAFSPEHMVGAWASEKRMFVARNFPNVSRTGNWADVGHYTQMIWRTTSHVGCAIASSRAHDVLVCRYSPPGNVMGQPVP